MYRLFFGEVELGEVTEEDGDFPSVFGRFTPVDRGDHPDVRRRVHEYAVYSIEADRLAQDEDDPEAYDRFAEEHEPEFMDLIESEDWFLVNEAGDRIPILIPVFSVDNGIVWRWGD